MRVLSCLYSQHNPWLIVMAALMCTLGSLITMRLFQRALAERGVPRLHWCLLSAVTAGSGIWATHFIAIIGYEPGVTVGFAGTLTVASALIAVVGSGLGLLIATSGNRPFAAIGGGGILGLSIAAMHYTGMLAYRPEGVVQWSPDYVAASIVAAVLFAILALERVRRTDGEPLVPALLLVAAIVTLHFTGMAAFSVTPLPGIDSVVNVDAFSTLAGVIAMVALLIVASGTSTQLVEKRTRAASEEQLRYIALHDSLTGLSNRRYFNEQLQAECAQMQQAEVAGFALMMIDLDRFKPVNDTLGHPAGDKVLRKVAQRLRRAVRDSDVVARIGGDEFAVIAHDLADAAAAKQLADRIVELVGRPFVIDGCPAEIGASVGLALAPEHGTDAEELALNADVALYTAKREGRGRTCVFEPHLTLAIQHRRALEADLRRACMREDFHILYQPVKEAGSDRFIGAEALVRWCCPLRGLVPPSEFIPLAEELGLVPRIGALVLRAACREAMGWPAGLKVAVNLSPIQLLDAGLPDQVAQALEESGLEPDRLELEITETALLGNDELALASLEKLRDLGVRISLDDFGTGYSSLSYLHRFPIHRIKIDRSFVQRLPTDDSSASIVRAIAQLGSSLKMEITAEGIESIEQLQVIAEYGCNHVQGFYISEPIAPEEIVRLFGREAGSKAA